MKKIMVGMSGGVDSSAAALLLMRQGFRVAGVTFRLWESEQMENAIQSAAAVCKNLEIEHTVLDLREDFRSGVTNYFVQQYLRGKTPNPCIICNNKIKFGKFSQYALANGFDGISTGHYAQVSKNDFTGRMELHCAEYLPKDQSYFLYKITQKQLEMLYLPLAGLAKPEIRKIAAEAGLPSASRSDSQDVCFIPDGDFTAFIERYTKEIPSQGQFVSADGAVLGTHRGIHHYTIGQRKGLGIALGKPAFVSAIDTKNNTVTLTTDETELFTDTVVATDINMIAVERLDKPTRCAVKLRSAHRAASAVAEQMDDNTLIIKFDRPQRAPAAGQAAVLYDGDNVLGGGEIV